MFKKQFPQNKFIKALSFDWKKTREIADNVGCKNRLVTDTLLNLYDVVFVGWLTIPLNTRMEHRLNKKTKFCVYNSVELVEWQWTKGGKQGTREWRLKKGKEVE